MKKISKLIPLIISAFSLSSCSFIYGLISSEETSHIESSEVISSEEGSSSEIISSEEGTSEDISSESESSSESHSESESTSESSSSDSSSSEEQGPRSLSIYTFNDFHGAVNEEGYEVGAKKFFSFMKQKKDHGALIVNAGDTFQGSLESNYNRGQMLTDIMNYVEVDAMALGNHEFDWGQHYVELNREKAKEPDYQTPFLAANIYRYNMQTGQTGEYADLGDRYTIKTMDNGLKVGIIGAIGQSQITSISSAYVDDLIFLDPTPIVKDLATELKNDKHCDVVVLAIHEEQAKVDDEVTSTIPTTAKRYVDAVVCAHTHRREKQIVNGVPFVQASCNGQAYGNIELTVNNGSVSATSYNYYYSSNATSSITIDSTINNIVNAYNTESNKIGNVTLGTLNGDLASSSTAINFMTYAIGEKAREKGYDIDYAICNNARANLDSGSITYSKLFKSFPFDNLVYIIRVKGSDIIYRLNYNSMTRYDTQPISSNKYYTVATIDYLATHRNESRQYDYFSTMAIQAIIEDDDYDLYNYREIAAEYLKSHNTINASNFANSVARHNRDNIYNNL